MLEVLTSNLSNIQGSPDLKAAREVADYIGTRHHEFHFTVQVVTVFIILSLTLYYFNLESKIFSCYARKV